jgi:hypothetical protein
MNDEETEYEFTWYERLGCALLGCTWPIWLILILWLVLAMAGHDVMGG